MAGSATREQDVALAGLSLAFVLLLGSFDPVGHAFADSIIRGWSQVDSEKVPGQNIVQVLLPYAPAAFVVACIAALVRRAGPIRVPIAGAVPLAVGVALHVVCFIFYVAFESGVGNEAFVYLGMFSMIASDVVLAVGIVMYLVGLSRRKDA